MQLAEAHPFRWIRERPRLAGIVKDGAPFLRYDVCDLVDVMEGSLGARLDADMAGYVPSPMSLPDDRRERYLQLERTAAIATSRFFRNGRNVVKPTPELIGALQRTDLDHVEITDLRWPFEVFHIAFGDTLGLTLPGTDCIIDGLTFDVRQSGSAPFIQVLLTTRLPVHAALGQRIREARQASPVHALTLTHGTTLTEMLDEEIELQVNGLDDLPDPAAREAEAIRLRASRETFRKVLSVAFNVIAYMTAEPDDIRRDWTDDAPVAPALRNDPSRMPVGVRNRLVTEGFVRIAVVGANLARELGLPGPGSDLSWAHWRRGHWRRQRHGAALSAVRLRWIRPVMVRPDLPESPKAHLYVPDINPNEEKRDG
jgi:hypothetical protein